MKKIKNLTILKILPLLLVSMLWGCEEVIDINLNSSNPRISADGYIDLDSVAKLQLSYTSDYFSEDEPEFIKDATVTLTDSRGNIDTLRHSEKGYYTGSNIRGQINTEYSLEIVIDDSRYTCNTVMYEPPVFYGKDIDTVRYGPPHAPTRKLVDVHIKKGDHPRSTYFAQFALNDSIVGDRFNYISEFGAVDDTLTMGVFIAGYDGEDEYEADTLNYDILLYAVDEQVFEFYEQLVDILGNASIASAAPYNPKSNIDNEMLGVFAARAGAKFRMYTETRPEE